MGNNISYNYNKEEHKTQQCSNLTVLLSRKGICAGYSLLFKEMMDRQQIPCDYMRGQARDYYGQSIGKHAWNVLQIDGRTFAVDLTWDSDRFHQGIKELEYFGCKEDFFRTHEAESDERYYSYVIFEKQSINKDINTDNAIKQHELSEQQKLQIVKSAMEETYKKFEEKDGAEIAKAKIKKSILDYITEGKTTGFTRQNMARSNIQQFVNRDDMIKIFVDKYVEDAEIMRSNGQLSNDILKGAIQKTNYKHGVKHGQFALKKYITENNVSVFTRDYGVRDSIIQNMNPKYALEQVISNMVDREIDLIDRTLQIQKSNIEQAKKMYFNGDELAKVEAPQKNVIQTAMQWIKAKALELKQMSNTEKNIKEKNVKIEEKQEDYERN